MYDISKPYASHVPVLKALGQHLPIKRVVEYGAGPASTSVFLNRNVFPQLTSLVSYEDSNEWCERLRRDIQDDRWDLREIVHGNYVADARFVNGYDLAFIDTQTADSRVALLRELQGQAPIVVLHDYDGPESYRRAIAEWSHKIIFKGMSPNTAIASFQRLPNSLRKALV